MIGVGDDVQMPVLGENDAARITKKDVQEAVKVYSNRTRWVSTALFSNDLKVNIHDIQLL